KRLHRIRRQRGEPLLRVARRLAAAFCESSMRLQPSSSVPVMDDTVNWQPVYLPRRLQFGSVSIHSDPMICEAQWRLRRNQRHMAIDAVSRLPGVSARVTARASAVVIGRLLLAGGLVRVVTRQA